MDRRGGRYKRPLRCWHLGLGGTGRHPGARSSSPRRTGLVHIPRFLPLSCMVSTASERGGDPSTCTQCSERGTLKTAFRTVKELTRRSVTEGRPSEGSYPMKASSLLSVD